MSNIIFQIFPLTLRIQRGKFAGLGATACGREHTAIIPGETVMTMEYRTIDLRTEEGRATAERLIKAGWIPGEPGYDTLQFRRFERQPIVVGTPYFVSQKKAIQYHLEHGQGTGYMDALKIVQQKVKDGEIHVGKKPPHKEDETLTRIDNGTRYAIESYPDE